MSAHKGRCFRALRRKRRQEKRRKAQPPLPAPASRSGTVADKLWTQFAGLGQMMRTLQKADQETKQQVRQHRQQTRGG